jgi:hypothetical protein
VHAARALLSPAVTEDAMPYEPLPDYSLAIISLILLGDALVVGVLAFLGLARDRSERRSSEPSAIAAR